MLHRICLRIAISLISFSAVFSLSEVYASGQALIGGYSGASTHSLYAADVSTQVAVEISNLLEPGQINSVAITGMGLIGGRTFDSSFAALVSNGTATQISVEGPGIRSVAINSAEMGLIGGTTTSNLLFAASVINGLAYDLDLSDSGTVRSVAINDSGIGLIGGDSEGNPYAATIDKGVATPGKRPFN